MPGAAHPQGRPRVLAVMQGSGGGIGRLELLYLEMLRILREMGEIDFDTVSREPHPSYLGVHAPAGQRLGKATFSLQAVRRFRDYRPDVVVFTHVNQAPLALALRRVWPRARAAVIVYGWDVWFGLSSLRRWGLRAIDAAWSISEYSADKLSETTGYPRSQVRLFAPVLSPDLAAALEATAPEAGAGSEVWLLSTARLDPGERQKGIDHVLGALALLKDDLPQLRYRIGGDGGDRPRLEELAARLGVADRVDFAGFISRPRLGAEYRGCDIFALPSAQEGFGLVYLEAMAARRPVIAARAGAAPEVVANGETGLLVGYGDEAELAEAIRRLAADPALREKLGCAGWRRFNERYRFETGVARLRELIGELRRAPR